MLTIADPALLVKEVNGDFVDLYKKVVESQAKTAKLLDTLHQAELTSQTKVAELTAKQQAEMDLLLKANIEATNDADFVKADNERTTLEALYAAEVKYVIALAGGDLTAFDPTPTV